MSKIRYFIGDHKIYEDFDHKIYGDFNQKTYLFPLVLSILKITNYKPKLNLL